MDMQDEPEQRGPNPQMVEDLFHAIVKTISDAGAMNGEALCALSAVIIAKCMEMGIPKGIMLSNLSNNWELNDPENEHPLRDMAHKIKI
jgi:hypothetical protein